MSGRAAPRLGTLGFRRSTTTSRARWTGSPTACPRRTASPTGPRLADLAPLGRWTTRWPTCGRGSGAGTSAWSWTTTTCCWGCSAPKRSPWRTDGGSPNWYRTARRPSCPRRSTRPPRWSTMRSPRRRPVSPGRSSPTTATRGSRPGQQPVRVGGARRHRAGDPGAAGGHRRARADPAPAPRRGRARRGERGRDDAQTVLSRCGDRGAAQRARHRRPMAHRAGTPGNAGRGRRGDPAAVHRRGGQPTRPALPGRTRPAVHAAAAAPADPPGRRRAAQRPARRADLRRDDRDHGGGGARRRLRGSRRARQATDRPAAHVLGGQRGGRSEDRAAVVAQRRHRRRRGDRARPADRLRRTRRPGQ